MTPSLSAELYRQGLIIKEEALWIMVDGRIRPNKAALFDCDGNPKF